MSPNATNFMLGELARALHSHFSWVFVDVVIPQTWLRFDVHNDFSTPVRERALPAKLSPLFLVDVNDLHCEEA
jgi:hypothetical protein